MFGHHLLESSRGNERVIFEDVLQMIPQKKLKADFPSSERNLQALERETVCRASWIGSCGSFQHRCCMKDTDVLHISEPERTKQLSYSNDESGMLIGFIPTEGAVYI